MSQALPHPLRSVLLALLPGIVVMVLVFGIGVLGNLAIAVSTCVAAEAVLLRLQGRAAVRPLTNFGTAGTLLTGALLGLSLPPGAPGWLAALGALVAMLLGNRVSGVLGRNRYNPAMLGLAALLIAFPVPMTQWAAPKLPWIEVDALSSATVLEQLRTGEKLGRTIGEVWGDAAFEPSANVSTVIALAWLAGGLFILRRKAIRWQIPAGVLGGLGALALPFWLHDPDRYASPLFHCLSGASMLGAFVVATDPGSAPNSPRGRFVYGLGIGALTWIFRGYGNYPDGFCFAVLALNACAPLIDRSFGPSLREPGKRPVALGAYVQAALVFIAVVLSATTRLPATERIPASSRLSLIEQLNELVPQNEYDNDLAADTLTLDDPALGLAAPATAWRARRGGQAVAVILPAIAHGYGGPIELRVAIRASGRLAGVRVTAHHETPGFGNRVDPAVDGWILGFTGKSLDTPRRWALRRDGGDFDQFSGATITPQAVLRAVHAALEYFHTHREALFAAPASESSPS